METLAVVGYFGTIYKIDYKRFNNPCKTPIQKLNPDSTKVFCFIPTAETKYLWQETRLSQKVSDWGTLNMRVQTLSFTWISFCFTQCGSLTGRRMFILEVTQQNHQCVACRLDVFYFCDSAFLLNNVFRVHMPQVKPWQWLLSY